MQEVCYCGRRGKIEDRELVVTADGAQALECPECGHRDHLEWLPEVARQAAFEKAKNGRRKAA